MYDKPENISDNAQNCFDNLRGFMTTERGIYLPLYVFLVQYGHYVKIQYFNTEIYICYINSQV